MAIGESDEVSPIIHSLTLVPAGQAVIRFTVASAPLFAGDVDQTVAGAVWTVLPDVKTLHVRGRKPPDRICSEFASAPPFTWDGLSHPALPQSA